MVDCEHEHEEAFGCVRVPRHGESSMPCARIDTSRRPAMIVSVHPELPEAGSPQTVLFARVRKYLNQARFVPFRIVTSSGRAYDVPTADHAVLHPMLRMLIIADDSGGSVDIHTLHVAVIEPLRGNRRKRAA